jgi:hypothetical protein
MKIAMVRIQKVVLRNCWIVVVLVLFNQVGLLDAISAHVWSLEFEFELVATMGSPAITRSLFQTVPV